MYVRVNCIINGRFCGRCCYETEMILTEEDIRRIERLGFKREEFSVEKNGVYMLRNVNGKCFFLDEENRCRIYEHRPIGCRIYPVIFDLDKKRAVLDDECPRRNEVDKRDLIRAERILRRIIRSCLGNRI